MVASARISSFISPVRNFLSKSMWDSAMRSRQRRKTSIPAKTPLALTGTFSVDSGKQLQWNAFRRKGQRDAPDLDEVIESLATFLIPLLTGEARGQTWHPESGWTLNKS